MEKWLQQCLPYLAKSLGKLVISSDNPDLQTHAGQLMNCDLDRLQQEVELRLQASPPAVKADSYQCTMPIFKNVM